MFSRENLQDSYTLDNYVHFMKNKNYQEKSIPYRFQFHDLQQHEFINDGQQQIQVNNIQKVQYFNRKKRKFSTQLSLFSWLVKDKPIQNSLLISLDKQLILKIYSYLRISQVVVISQSCSYLFSCYKSLWIDKNFFQQFQTDKFTSEQLNKVIQKSKLDHIKHLKQIYMGKNIRKNRQKIKMRLTDGSNCTNSILEVFSISPKLKNGVVFFMDSHLQNIINSFYKGLKCIQLNRCAYVKNISTISKCIQLQKLVITYNEYVNTENLSPIFKRCLKLEKIQLSQCKMLDQNVFKYLKNLQQLTSLTMKSFKQSFGNLASLSNCPKLQHLNIDDSLITDSQLTCAIREIKTLKRISIEGCALLTDQTILFLDNFLDKKQTKIKEISIQRIPNIQLQKIQAIQQKIYRNSLLIN